MAEEEKPRPLKYAIDVLRYANLGDHAEILRESHEPVPGETVRALVERVLVPKYGGEVSATDVIEIKVQVAPDGHTWTPPRPAPPQWPQASTDF